MTSSPAKVLVVGGTGPSGVPLVNTLIEHGFEVTVFHSGAHEAEFVTPVRHLHGDTRDDLSIKECLSGERWDLAICTSGRLRSLAAELAGRVRRLVGITGQPVYRGTMEPTPEGSLPLPLPEWSERQRDRTGYTGRVADGEDQLFAQHGKGDFEAVVVRYPGVYGPRAPVNHEWAVVRRILDGRRHMAMPHDGMAYFQRGYVDNVARLVFLAATRPEAAGHAFNCGDEQVLSARTVAQVIVEELGANMDFVGVDARFSRGLFPLAEKSSLILNMSKARTLLGYRDVVPVVEATRRTARWLVKNPPREEDLRAAGSGSFDYALEDRLISAQRRMYEEFTTRQGE